MNTRPTPETDAFAIKFKTTCGEKYWVPVDIARRLESERDEARGQRDRLAEALRKLADCDWVITPHDRMDAVREIARKALQSLTPNEPISK